VAADKKQMLPIDNSETGMQQSIMTVELWTDCIPTSRIDLTYNIKELQISDGGNLENLAAIFTARAIALQALYQL